MKELIEYIAEHLVDAPASVKVRERRTSRGVQLELQVARRDMGRVIGKEGRVANAMRTVLRVPAMRQGQNVSLDID
ncbi:MAG: KH domain-containing protein [Chloroflexota bacterium]|nr:KH domain-containing protein [Chloroflexota bacterium]